MMARVKGIFCWPFVSETKNNQDQPKENWADQVAAISDAHTPSSKENNLVDHYESSSATSLQNPLDPNPPALQYYLETRSYLAPKNLTPSHANNIFKSLSPLRTALQIFGAIPYIYDEEEREYRLKWINPNALRTLINALYMSVLLVTTTIGLFSMLVENFQGKHDEVKSDFSIKIMGVVIITGCLVNGCAAVLSILYYGHIWCKILNDWNNLVIAAEIDPMKGLKPTVRKFIIFLALFSFIMVILSLAGKPKVFALAVDGVAERMFMVPKNVLKDYASLATFIRVITCLVCLHIFAVFKGSLFSFTTNCHMLKNGFASWNAQLNNALEDIWRRRGRTRGRLGMLVQSHFHLVKMVRETESIFGPMLQCYYASTVRVLYIMLHSNYVNNNPNAITVEVSYQYGW